MTARPRLLILGASTRAAAWSAWRAGYQPVCVDLFLDLDLRAVAEVHPLDSYPDGFPAAVAGLPPTPWIYTGGLENFPEIVAEIAALHPLSGSGPEVLRLVRDPFWLDQFYSQHAFPRLRLSQGDAPPPTDGDWLLKSTRSSGGRQIVRWLPQATNSPLLSAPHYFQEYREGTPCSALFLATEKKTELVALFEQFIGHPQRPEVPPFAYRGSLFPVQLPENAVALLARFGSTLTKAANLQGLFGLDFVWGEGTVWPVEINPRYTASVELAEYATGRSLISGQLNGETQSEVVHQSPHPFLGKQIVYAPVPLRIGNRFDGDPDFLNREARPPWELPRFADVPPLGTEIRTGDPVCTLFAGASDRGTLLQTLAAMESELMHELGFPEGPAGG